MKVLHPLVEKALDLYKSRISTFLSRKDGSNCLELEVDGYIVTLRRNL